MYGHTNRKKLSNYAGPAQPTWVSIFLQKRGRQQPRGPSLGSPVTGSDEVVPSVCSARVYVAIQDEKWNGAFRKANHSNSTLKTAEDGCDGTDPTVDLRRCGRREGRAAPSRPALAGGAPAPTTAVSLGITGEAGEGSESH